MTNLNTVISFNVEKEAQLIIEKFVEDISDKLMINETYFGNLTSGINSLFLLLLENQPDTLVTISYNTDYQIITFIVSGVSRETKLKMGDTDGNIDKNDSNVVSTIYYLTETIEIVKDQISLVFDIGAMNRKVYNNRESLLFKYFDGKQIKKSIKLHD